ncbi:mannose-P-dolichol utilization defect 1 protein homolog [Macrosteles quadrilineatus]|uniref:mannose-P-dolichol utilization defect 1 protein homolog n=1 Tax=Macrosteles quadrilineatus TaxID=74068 RepID=UPI0023E0B726|nr:mannose-P-dolichol utilization defect 1 protein homolog [Macrosteles quadrilineatus]
MDKEHLYAYFKNMMLVLLPPKCYDEFFVNFNFLDVPCLKAAVSKGLGLAIVAGSLMVKLPQIIKIVQNKSAAGLSFLSVILDLYAVTTGVAYSYAKGFTFSAWGDALFLLIQTTLIAAMVLHFNYSSNLAAVFVGVFSIILYALLGGLTPLDILWSLQAVSVPIMFAGKMVQAWTNYSNGSTGQLSAMTCVMLLFGSTARIFTSIQETGDPVIIVTYALATLGNAVLVGQFIYYGYSGQQDSVKGKKAKKNAAKKAQ